MTETATTSAVSYVDVLFVFIILAVVTALYFLFRTLILKFLINKDKPSGFFLSRMNLPLVLLLLTVIFKIQAVRQSLPLSEKFYLYIDAAFLFFIIFLLIRLADAFIQSIYRMRGVSFPLPRVLHGLILGVIYLVILFVILRDILRINITPFLATSAILTMILGLAFQGVLSNILSGMSLHFTKSFHKGDWIQVGEDEGKVMDTNWRETRILDRYSNIVVLPNNKVASGKITNFSQPSPSSALTLTVKASYEAPPSSVLEALLEAAADVPEVSPAPAPEAYALSYDEFGISYLLKFWITDFDRKYPIWNEVGRLVWYKFKRRGIEIPLPLSDKVSDVLRAMREKEGIPAAELEKERDYQDLLHSVLLRYQEGERTGELLVPEKEIRELAASVRRVKFAPGEIIFKQGERGESCYVVSSGRIRGEIVYEEKGKKYRTDFNVERGGIFGEMSLFTGMPRTATGVVEVEAELLEITARDFSRLLERNKELAEIMAGMVSERNQKNKEFLKKIKELSAKDIEQSTNKRSILKRLKSLILRL
jgi:small-conductance mechanosensitive channel/CRP-like cAMP-binding protein